MNEILKNELCIYKYNEDKNKNEVIKVYHIYQKDDIIYVDAPLPVNLMGRLRRMLWYNDIQYKDLIIDKPYKNNDMYIWM